MVTVKKKKIHKYYVGASHIGNSIMHGLNDSHTHETLDSAILEGRKLMESDGRDVVIIVSIIRILKRKSHPIVVEKV